MPPPPRASNSIRLATLRVPLAAKLVGANLLVVAMLLAGCLATGGLTVGMTIGIVAAALALHLVLTLVALRPVRDLETVASRAWHGDFGARVARSNVADAKVLRIGSMFNVLLDGLEADRIRMRALAAEVIAAGDRERAALARELHDSTAQRVAALLLQLSAAARDASDPALADRLGEARNSAEGILEELRLLSHTVHPGVLDDLGLEAALRRLGRDSSHGNGVDVDVNFAEIGRRLPAAVESALYRVAQEAVRNATRHGSPRHVRIQLRFHPDSATLDIHDDGTGFDLAEVDARRNGVGLLSMRERIALVGGTLDIRTAVGNGTTISAIVPLDTAAAVVHSENA